VQHENLHLSQWMQRYFTQHHGTPSFFHHEHNEEGGSLWSVKVGHRCNVRSQGLVDEGGPSCTSWRKECLKPNQKKRIIRQGNN